MSPHRLDDFLWKIEKGGVTWNMHHCDIPRLTFIVGYTGIHAATGPLVARVRKLVDSDKDAKGSIDRIEEIVLAGVEAIKKSDRRRLGALMNENHSLLNGLGVGHPALEKLVKASIGHSYGAKLTGAGGGGSIIALTDDADKVSEAIEQAGGKALKVSVGCEGVRVERFARRGEAMGMKAGTERGAIVW